MSSTRPRSYLDGPTNNIREDNDDDTLDGGKAWEKTEDIPRRFDELPPEQDWIPVADVIRTQREEMAKYESQQIKIMPPSELETQDSFNANETGYYKKSSSTNDRFEDIVPKSKTDDVVGEETDIDKVTHSMMNWALKTEYDSKRRKSHQEAHGEQDPPHLSQASDIASKHQPKELLAIPDSVENDGTSDSGRGNYKQKDQRVKNVSPKYNYSPHLRTRQFEDDYKEHHHRSKEEYNVEYKVKDKGHYQEREQPHQPERYHHGRERAHHDHMRDYGTRDRDYSHGQDQFYYEGDDRSHYLRRDRDSDYRHRKDYDNRETVQRQEIYQDDKNVYQHRRTHSGQETRSTSGHLQDYGYQDHHRQSHYREDQYYKSREDHFYGHDQY